MKQVSEYQIFTIGNGNRKSKDFISLLQRFGLEVVIDVRTYPYSRFNPHFRKAQLETDLKEAGIEYLFLGNELGGRPKNHNLYVNGVVSYPAIKKTQAFIDGIKKVVELVREGVKVTLMCSEADPDICHRKHLISDVLINEGLTVIHINKVGSLELHTTNKVISLFD